MINIGEPRDITLRDAISAVAVPLCVAPAFAAFGAARAVDRLRTAIHAKDAPYRVAWNMGAAGAGGVTGLFAQAGAAAWGAYQIRSQPSDAVVAGIATLALPFVPAVLSGRATYSRPAQTLRE